MRYSTAILWRAVRVANSITITAAPTELRPRLSASLVKALQNQALLAGFAQPVGRAAPLRTLRASRETSDLFAPSTLSSQRRVRLDFTVSTLERATRRLPNYFFFTNSGTFRATLSTFGIATART